MRAKERLSIAVLVALTLVACGPRRVVLNGVEMSVEEAARAELDAARAKAAAGDHAGAAALFEDVQQRYHDAEEADEALLGAGESWEAAAEPEKARRAYEALVERYPSSDKAGLARARALSLGGDRDAALEAAKDAYAQIPDAEKYAAAVQLADAAEKAGKAAEALRFREEAVRRARNPEEQQAAQAKLVQLVDARLSFLQVAELAAAVEDDAPAAPLLHFKLARIYQHLRDYQKLEGALAAFVQKFPAHAYAPEAKALLERIQKRGTVDPTKIGVVLPLSGNATYKRAGEQYLAGLKLAFEGSPVTLVVRDSKGEPADAAAAVEALVYEDHVIAVVGGVITHEAQAVALKAAELQVPAIVFSRAEGVTALGEYVFRDMLTNSQMAAALAEYAVGSRGMKRFAVLHPELTYGEELRDAFKAQVEARGGTVKAVGSYPQDETTFSEAIKKLVGKYDPQDFGEWATCRKEAAAIEDPRRRRNAYEKCAALKKPVIEFQALLLPDKWQNIALVAAGLAFEDVITNWCDKRDIERIEKTTKMKVKPVMLLGANLWNHPEMARRAGKYVNCSIFVDGFHASSSRPETQAFVQSFATANGRPPGLLEAYGYDAGRVLRAVAEGRKPGTRPLFREALLAVRDLPGPMGPTSVSAERELVHPLFFLTVDRGEIRETDPAKKDGPP